jgi:hypothetical protein
MTGSTNADRIPGRRRYQPAAAASGTDRYG